MGEAGTQPSDKLIIAYRVYPKFSKNAYTDGFTDKFDMFTKCLSSFLNALEGIDYRIHFLLDTCPSNYDQFITENLREDRYEIEHLTNAGNRSTFLRQIEFLTHQDFSRIVYFAEDDYLYKQFAIKELFSFFKNSGADFVTPYNHPDYYIQTSGTKVFQHRYKSEIVYSGGMQFRTVSSTTLTFMTSVETLKRTKKYLSRYLTHRIKDQEVWLMLTHLRKRSAWFGGTADMYLSAPIQVLFGRKYKLFASIPGLATHLASPYALRMGDLKEFQ